MKEKIKSLHLQARKDKDALAKDAYESVATEIQLKEIELKRILTDAESTKALQKAIKQFTETAEGFEKISQMEKAEETRKKGILLSALLPQSLTDEQVKDLILSVTAEEAIPFEKKSMGNVVKLVVAKANGQTDGKTVSTIFNSLL